jgi:pimeloyl-ACP methyl ester carboxylesterase
MRRGSVITLGAGLVGAVLAGALVRHRLRTRGPARPKPVTGSFANGMGYARVGTGPKTLLWLGGPFLGAPGGPLLALMAVMVRPFVAAGYSVWIVSQRPNMAVGYTVADMAEDYAQVIAEEFGGKVDLVIGESTGGMIGFCLAARHADRFGHIAIGVAGYTMTEQGKVANRDSARLLSEGRKTEAAAVLGNLMYPGIRRIPAPVARVPAAIVARVNYAAPYIPSDVTIVADAVNAFDGREILPEISVPVLLACGDRDRWFAKEVYQETVRLIPDCTLKLYPGKDHLGAMSDRRFPQDVLDFVRQHQHVPA